METDRLDDSYDFRQPNEADIAIADNLRTFLEAEIDRNPTLQDAVNLQFGVRSLGNVLMGELSEIDFGDREVVYFGEVIQDGQLDPIDEGLLSGASAASLAFSVEGQERLFENIVFRPANIPNNPALIDQFGVVEVNSAVGANLYGNVNATQINGTYLINGIGGGGYFNRNCRPGTISLPSTADGNDLLRIVPNVPHVDHTKHNHSVIVAEHGVAHRE